MAPITWPRRNIAGQRFDRHVAIMPSHKQNGQWYWWCECDCSPGSFRPVNSGALFAGTSRSCGCIQREVATGRFRAMGKANRRHGQSHTSEHKIWDGMLQRCSNPNAPSYKNYGARGITEAFYADMGPRPDGLSIDRIDNDGNYEPGNCRWATWHEQRMNSRPRKRCATTGRYMPKGR